MTDLTGQIEIGILDFYQKNEARKLVESLKKHLKFKCDIVFYDNGTPENYSEDFLEEGLITRLVKNDKNLGCGPATVQMYDNCQSENLLYIQSDQELVEPLFGEQIFNAIQWLKDGIFHCIDLAGNQGQGRFSERANLMSVEFYKNIPKQTLGGPGITNDQKYVEEWVQDYFADNECKIAHIAPTFFADRGYYSVRELPCGSILKHSCWTKETWVMNHYPKNRYEVYPPLNGCEWHNIKDLIPFWGEGKRGYIPESQAEHSFSNQQVEQMIERDICV